MKQTGIAREDHRSAWACALNRGACLAAVLLGVVLLPAPVEGLCNHDSLRNGTEQCDGADLGGYRCTDLCFAGGTLACKTDCTFDTANCCRCGNNRREAACNEICDGSDVAGQTCQTVVPPFPEGGPPLTCNSACNGYDTTRCFWCGNGTKEGPEECDGNDFGPAGDDCTGAGEHGGTLGCTTGGTQTSQYPTGCKIDRQFCWVCGNGRIDPGEQCDGGSGCSATCQRTCGDGIVQYTEGCDDGNTTADDGCTDCGSDLVYFGGNDEVDTGGKHYDQCMLRWGVEAPYSGGSQAAVTQQTNGFTVTCRDGIDSCDRDTVSNQCTFLSFYCLSMAALTPGACFKSNIARIDILLPATTVSSADQTTILNAFKDTFVRIGGASPGSISQSATSLVLSSPISLSSMCGAFSVVVPRPGTTTATQVLALRASDNGGPVRQDNDQITYVCQP